MTPGIGEFSGGSGSYGDSTGPATSGTVGQSFGNFISGGTGSNFNPFAKSAAGNLLTTQNLLIVGAVALAFVYLKYKK